MDNLLVYSLLGLVAMNGFLWVWILFRGKSEAKIISIIANALKRGDSGSFRIYYGSRSLTLENKIIELLCDYLNINIVRINAQPKKYVVVKRSKKA